ncbi:unnamed protein product [Nezara viridula]|uniref:Uncharacterized protein n=1 Tax=Nezara viridula TaxID=85310 RepID=A0A9P0E2F0_NEZVI|nr:unnamed protein product [Nezara viridula]
MHVPDPCTHRRASKTLRRGWPSRLAALDTTSLQSISTRLQIFRLLNYATSCHARRGIGTPALRSSSTSTDRFPKKLRFENKLKEERNGGRECRPSSPLPPTSSPDLIVSWAANSRQLIDTDLYPNIYNLVQQDQRHEIKVSDLWAEDDVMDGQASGEESA